MLLHNIWSYIIACCMRKRKGCKDVHVSYVERRINWILEEVTTTSKTECRKQNESPTELESVVAESGRVWPNMAEHGRAWPSVAELGRPGRFDLIGSYSCGGVHRHHQHHLPPGAAEVAHRTEQRAGTSCNIQQPQVIQQSTLLSSVFMQILLRRFCA